MYESRPSQARIDLEALAANYAVARRRAGGRDVIAVVKADAYGHGAVPVAQRLVREGCPQLAVVTVSEAAELRDAGVTVPLLLMGGLHGREEARAAIALALTPVLHDEAQRVWLDEAARSARAPVPVHVEVDTGMSRMGVPADEAPALLERVAASDRLRLAGAYTHLACADDPDPAPSRAQLERFEGVLAQARGLPELQLHVANSAGLLAAAGWGDGVLGRDAVRPGLMLYGVAPASHLADEGLRPVMTLRTQVVTVRRLAAGDGVGYGATWRAPAAGWLATLPLGYADGVPWSLANRGEVWLAGQRRPLVGRVSMDFLTVWMGDEAPSVGDEAILFGGDAKEGIPVEDVAAAAGTLAYELLVRVGSRVPRVVVG